MANVQFSDFQNRIFSSVINGKGNIAINAVAGSGKTFTIVECVKRLPRNAQILFLAFNNSIVAELKEKLAEYPNVTVKTCHSFANSTLYKANGYKTSNVDEKAASELICSTAMGISEEIDFESEKDEISVFQSNVKMLYKFARLEMLQSGDIESLQNLVEQHGIEIIADEINVVSTMLLNAYNLPQMGQSIDFVDMLVLGTKFSQYSKKYDYVFIDECQDLSTAQRKLMLSAVKRGSGRFIAVGDPKQAINGFAGANNNSFDLIAQLPNTTTMPLSVNYRCGSKIVELAQKIVPQITAHDGAIDGEILAVNSLVGVKVGDMVLCRKSAPLMSVCLKMLAKGIRANILGRDLSVGLKSLIAQTKAKTIDSLSVRLGLRKEKMIQTLIRENVEDPYNHPKYVGLCDKIECIEALCDNCRSIAQLNELIDRLFVDEDGKFDKSKIVTFCTCHKSKGLECDNVWVLLPNKLPMTWEGQLDWQFEQEMNLKYVTITRAKKRLIWVNVPEKQIANIVV